MFGYKCVGRRSLVSELGVFWVPGGIGRCVMLRIVLVHLACCSGSNQEQLVVPVVSAVYP